ncbi:MAG: phage tail sheath family protein [Epsilonproteobacteria bacterium]|nr:MAG: phage tail sheath family protein [Campylobacterota bacterium]
MGYSTPGVYIKEISMGAKPVTGVSTSIAGFVGITEKGADEESAVFISSWGNFTENFGRYTTGAPYLAPAVHSFFANGGTSCYVVSIANAAVPDTEEADPDTITDINYTGSAGATPDKRKGLAVLEAIDEVSIIAIPGNTSSDVQKAMLTHCETLKDRFCIFDTDENDTIEQTKTLRNLLTSDGGYGAVYYPWIEVGVESGNEDTLTLESMFIPPSGAIAGIYARSDNEKGVHKAPANEIIRNVTRLKVNLTNSDQGTLNDVNVNCLRSFPGRGIRVWGARTISTDIDWRYVNVRRLFIYLEESIDESTQWVVFEPNNEQLWARVTQTINNFLTGLWRDGALMGSSPEEAFFVRCDKTTMTPEQIANGELIAVIGVAPTKPAEFVIFKIAQTTIDSK